MPMLLPSSNTLSRRSSLLATCLLAACSPFSTHAPPSGVVVPNQFSQAPAGKASDLSAWWRAWNDPALTLAIENALKANPDLRIARDHILQAEATQAVARSTLGPTLGITGNIAGGGMDWRNCTICPPAMPEQTVISQDLPPPGNLTCLVAAMPRPRPPMLLFWPNRHACTVSRWP